jgi:hypothetical protein
MMVFPISIKAANAYVQEHHRHAKPVRGAKFCLAVCEIGQGLLGVAIVGRPVARALDDGRTAEIRRVCTTGARNACSMLYVSARATCKAMGYARVITYTLADESGASLRAAGFVRDGDAGRPSKDWHSRPGRTVGPVGDDMVGGKVRWSVHFARHEKLPRRNDLRLQGVGAHE